MSPIFRLFLVSLLVTPFSSSHAQEAPVAPPKPKKEIAASAWKEFGRVPIQSGGRIKPLDSYMRENTILTTGSRAFGGFEPIEMLLSWMTEPDAWMKTDFIKVARKDLQKQLLLDESRSRYSPSLLLGNPALMQYAQGLEGRQAPQAAPMGGLPSQSQREQELRKLVTRIQTFKRIVSGDELTLIPQPDRKALWLSLADQLKMQQFKAGSKESAHATAIATSPEIAERFKAIIEAYRAGDSSKLETESVGLRSAVEAMIPEWSDSDHALIDLESLNNRVHPFLWSMVLYLLAAGLWIVVVIRKKDAWMGWVATFAAFGMHIYGFGLRMWISGRPPVSNMYESMIWVSFGIMTFALILYRLQRQAILPAVASMLSAFVLLAADAAPAVMDPMIHPLVPVLRSNYWLTIHVLTITLGYAAFALSLGLANVSLWFFWRQASAGSASKKAVWTPKITNMNQLCYRAMQFGVVLLAAGTILGGVWADYSWGRFWGWDPKEVWALIALLCYLAILHARYTGWVGQLAYSALSVSAFLSVVMAWYGVNFVLGVGLHSYGFASGGGYWVGAFCGLQLIYVIGIVLRVKRSRLKAA